ncbi:MAG: universal stress protein [Myxococcales bacterium]|nr:universal stress protein [Myxococcales bacterium]
MTKRILVATDLSDGADIALDLAKTIAERDGAELAVVHVIPDVGPVNMLFPQANEKAALAITDLTQRASEALEAKLEARLGGFPARVFVDAGVDYERIIDRANELDADLVLVGSHGRTGLARALLGSVAEKVVRNAGRRVLVVRPGHDGPVISATDMSEPSLPAIRAGAAEAKRRGAELIAAYALEVSAYPPGYAAGWPFGIYWDGVDPNTVSQLREAAKSALVSACELAEAKAEPRIIEGNAAAEIARLAETTGASLVVTGTHGRTGLTRLALGSVAEKIVRLSPCSVLVVPVPDK